LGNIRRIVLFFDNYYLVVTPKLLCTGCLVGSV